MGALIGLYGEWIVPALIDLSMRNKRLRPYRERVAGVGTCSRPVPDQNTASSLNSRAKRLRSISNLQSHPHTFLGVRENRQQPTSVPRVRELSQMAQHSHYGNPKNAIFQIEYS